LGLNLEPRQRLVLYAGETQRQIQGRLEYLFLITNKSTILLLILDTRNQSLHFLNDSQAISLLVRVYHYTREHRYLRSAVRALAPFMRPIPSEDAGVCAVRTHFLGQPGLPWFEEYPIIPSVFVLNGFIYSLIGLFDLTSLEGVSPDQEELSKSIGKSDILFNEGLSTLVHVLPLFDSGSGSFYDLRHLNLSGPNRARWQYHFVHLRQLKTLTKMAPQHADLWKQTFRRWLAYTRGFRSLHN
uniref:Heparosan-N-sulfate-glucuronate 5-epimerase n=1 Tax=Schistocephalus solidus TaxID=70667 RepID=A0A183TS53_SCHSO